jgi:hypothetical protein
MGVINAAEFSASDYEFVVEKEGVLLLILMIFLS